MNTNDFRKEIDFMIEALTKEDPLGVLIRGHLYVESRLMQVISFSLRDPGAIDLTRLQFPIKLDLAVAMGLLTENDKRGYARLNALRNQVAHRFNSEISETDERSLYNALNREQKKAGDVHREAFSGLPLSILRTSILSLCKEILGKLVQPHSKELLEGLKKETPAKS